MPYIRRRRILKRKAYRKRKGGMRKRGMTKKFHGVKYHTVKAVGFTNLTSGSAGTNGTNYNLSTTFLNVPGFSDYASLYQQYAILGVKYTYTPRYNSTSSFGGVGIPRMFIATDKNELSTIPIATLQEQDNVMVKNATSKWSRYVKFPMPALFQQDINGNAIQVQPKAKTIQWLNTQQQTATNIPHLALLVDVEDNSTANPIVCGEVTAQFYLAFKEQQ